MRIPRRQQFDPTDPPWLHCVSRCVRRAFLCGDGHEHRKEWLERRLRLLARCFAVDVGSFSILSNHAHLVLRPRPQRTSSWSAEEVARAWWHVRRNVDPVDDMAIASDQAQIDALARDADFVARWRERLGSLSWFMRELREPLSRLANREDDCTGRFWEGRFSSKPLLDMPAIVACMAYVDLNPIRAQLAITPESSAHTSIALRIATRDAPDRVDWLVSVPAMTSTQAGDPGLSLAAYLELVDCTGRGMRAGKRGAIPAELPQILARIDPGLDPATWLATQGRPRSLLGAALGGLDAMRREAQRRSKRWLQQRCALFMTPPRRARVC